MRLVDLNTNEVTAPHMHVMLLMPVKKFLRSINHSAHCVVFPEPYEIHGGGIHGDSCEQVESFGRRLKSSIGESLSGKLHAVQSSSSHLSLGTT